MHTMETLARVFLESHPADAARTLERLEIQEAVRVLERLPASIVGPVFEGLTPRVAGSLVESMGIEKTQALFQTMSPHHASAVLHHMEEGRRESLLASLPVEVAVQFRDLVRYAPDSAGGMMNPQVTSIAIDLNVGDAISAIRRAPRQTLYYLYVTDRAGKLVGVLNLREILLAQPKSPIEPLTRRELVTVPATTDREEVAALMQRHRFFALPVVDAMGRLLGVVKHDQLIQAVQQEAFEDLQKMVGAGGEERALSPLSTVIKKRLPWLYVNLATALVASAVVGLFESVIAKITALAVLMPIVAGQGGNTGAQTLAVVIRGLALREILPGAARRVILKETLGALLNGLAIAFVAAGVVYAWDRRPGLALVIGLAMVVNMLAAGFAGAAIPILLKRFGWDPAQSSSIFMTTITDVVGFASFLGFAVLLAPLLL